MHTFEDFKTLVRRFAEAKGFTILECTDDLPGLNTYLCKLQSETESVVIEFKDNEYFIKVTELPKFSLLELYNEAKKSGGVASCDIF